MLKELLKKKEEIEQRVRDIQAEIEDRILAAREELQAVNIDIGHLVSQKLVDLRSLTGKEFGVMHLIMDGYKVTETIPKKVEWDQEKLIPLFFRIMESGDKPSNYMTMKLSVAEKAYDAFPDTIKPIFAEARTVKPGPPSLKFEEVTNA